MLVSALLLVTPVCGQSSQQLPSLPQEEKPEPGYSAWLSADDYQAQFDRMVAAQRYPNVVEGRNVTGVRQYRGKFVPFPPGYFYFWSHSGISEEAFNRRDAVLRADGYRLTHRQNLDDALGRAVQAVWVRTRCLATSAANKKADDAPAPVVKPSTRPTKSRWRGPNNAAQATLPLRI